MFCGQWVKFVIKYSKDTQAWPSPSLWVEAKSTVNCNVLSPDSVSLSDSLSSSELELLEAFPWLWDWICPVWPSSSSSTTGLLGRAGFWCFSRSCRQIFSLLLIREIEVLQGRGQGGAEQQVACSEVISDGTHCTCSQLERACKPSAGETVSTMSCVALLSHHTICI